MKTLVLLFAAITWFGCAMTRTLTLNSGITDEFLLSIKSDNSIPVQTEVNSTAQEPIVAQVGHHHLFYNIYFSNAYRSDAANYFRTKFPNQDSSGYRLLLELKELSLKDTVIEKFGNPPSVDAEVKLISHLRIIHGDSAIVEKDIYSSYHASSSMGSSADELEDIIVHYISIAVRQNLIMVDKYLNTVNFK